VSEASEHSSRPTPDRRDEQRRYPWHFRLLTYVVTGLGSMLVWCWFKTLRVRVIGPEPDIADHVIYATWHRGILYAVFHWRWRNGVLMASASKDGEWAAGMIKRFGNRVVRGSSSRGGRVALQGLSEATPTRRGGRLESASLGSWLWRSERACRSFRPSSPRSAAFGFGPGIERWCPGRLPDSWLGTANPSTLRRALKAPVSIGALPNSTQP
jgi:hypothetical protein